MGRTVENVKIEIPMNKSVLNCSLTPNQGKYSFDPVSKLLAWDVGKIDPSKLPNIRGGVNFVSGARQEVGALTDEPPPSVQDGLDGRGDMFSQGAHHAGDA